MKKILLTLIGLAALSLAAQADTLISWELTSANGTVSPLAPTTSSAGLTAVGLTRGSGVAVPSSPAGNAWGAVSVGNGTTSASAITANDYVSFSLTANSGFLMSLSDIPAYNIRRSATGPTTGLWQYQVGSETFQDIGSPITWGSTTSATGNSQAAISLSGITDLQSVAPLTTVTFRVLLYNSSLTTGTWYFNNLSSAGNDLSVNGTVSALTVPGSDYYWTADGASLGGTGSWDNSATTWSANATAVSGTTWDSAKASYFQGTAGTVNLGAVSANAGISFNTTGYTLTNGTLTLGAASVGLNAITTNASVTSTINSVIAGSTGITKAGAGTLILGGANTFSGGIVISGGTLRISSDSALGDAANDLALNGTLATTSSIDMAVGRDISGSALLDIASGTTLGVAGNFSTTSLGLLNSGTLNLQGATRSLGALSFSSSATLNATGSVSISSLTATALTSGTATINSNLSMTTGTQTVDVGNGGTLALKGAVSGATTIVKSGLGTLALEGTNTYTTLRIGTSAASPTAGGTVVLSSAGSGPSSSIQLNYGSLQANNAGGLALSSSLSIGGRAGAVATLAGNDMEFLGAASFFRSAGTSGELALNVNNTTTLSGTINATSGTGTATGITFGGNGTLILSANAAALTETITISDSLKFRVNNVLGTSASTLAIAPTATLGGNGTVNGFTTISGFLTPGNSVGTLTFANGLTLNSTSTITMEINSDSDFDKIVVSSGTLTLGGTLNLVFGYTPASLVSYQLFDTTGASVTGSFASVQFSNAANGTFDSTTGSLTLGAVPEPSTWALIGLGSAFLLWRTRRKPVC